MLFILPMSSRKKNACNKIFFPADVLPRKVKKKFSEGSRQVMHIFPADVLLRTFYAIFSQFYETF